MRRPSNLPPGWQAPSGPSPRRGLRDASHEARSETSRRDERYARWHVPVASERESDGWLLSYLDLVSLLLVVFAVLWASSKIDFTASQADVSPVPALTAVTDAASGDAPLLADGEDRLSAEPGDPMASDQSTQSVALVSSLRLDNWNPMPGLDLAAYAGPALPSRPTLPEPEAFGLDTLALSDLGDDIDVIVNEKSISFRISSEALFASGQANLLPSGGAVLARLAKVLERNDRRISVEGHSDAVPIRSERFPSNWELSAGRAASVLRYLERCGISSGRLRATGYADTRPLASNETASGRAANRRIELVMEASRSQG